MTDRNIHSQFEPAADVRTAAHTLWGLYVALVQAGFSEAQALHIVTNLISQSFDPNEPQ